MTVQNIHFLMKDDPPIWDDLQTKAAEDFYHLMDETPWNIAIIEGGMSSGEPSVALRINLPDGKVMIAETSVRQWAATTIAMRAKFPEVFADGPLADR